MTIAEETESEIVESLPTVEVPARTLNPLARGSGPVVAMRSRSRTLSDRYELRRRLGGGGMAEVFHAWDHQLERDVAIKVLRPEMLQDPRQVDRFRREAQLLAFVESERVVQIYDSHFDPDECYLVLRHLIGRSLERVVDESGAMAPGAALQVALDVLEGLRGLHARHLVHRDVKPANVLVGYDDRAVLLDLGIALDRRRPSITPYAHTIGTPGFMPPEQQQSSQVDLRSDLYQVGLLLFHMTTAVDPSTLQPEAIAGDLMLRVPCQIAALIERAIAPPGERFQTVDEMTAAIRAAMHDHETVELALTDADAIADSEPILLVRRKAPQHGKTAAATRWAHVAIALVVAAIAMWALEQSFARHSHASPAVLSP